MLESENHVENIVHIVDADRLELKIMELDGFFKIIIYLFQYYNKF